MSAELRLRRVEADLRVAQALAADKRRTWEGLIRGAWTAKGAYDHFVVASIAYASAASNEAQLADEFFDAQLEAQREQLRLEGLTA